MCELLAERVDDPLGGSDTDTEDEGEDPLEERRLTCRLTEDDGHEGSDGECGVDETESELEGAVSVEQRKLRSQSRLESLLSPSHRLH